jgi:hypothetical protein
MDQTIDQPVGMSASMDQPVDSPSVDTGTDFAGPPPNAQAPPDAGGTDYDDDLAEGGPVPDIG